MRELRGAQKRMSDFVFEFLQYNNGVQCVKIIPEMFQRLRLAIYTSRVKLEAKYRHIS